MQFHSNELFLLDNPQSTMGKQTKALAPDICSNINAIDAIPEKLYKSKVAGKEYTMNGWLEVLWACPICARAYSRTRGAPFERR